MKIVLLSGGSGKRLWPLSNEVRSKQFIKIFENEEKELESMVQRVYRGIKGAVPNAKIVVSTGKAQTSGLINQLGDNVSVCVEPTRRDTFPAIALAAAYLKDVLNATMDETVVVCPVDPYVEQDYFEMLFKLDEAVQSGDANMYLMGIKPTYPSEKYGYIVADSKNRVIRFKEKPDLKTAEQLLKEGAWWNGGVFAFKLCYILDIAHELIEFENYADLKGKYGEVNKISFDYAVVEKEKNIGMLPFCGEWKDLGTWNTLSEAMTRNTIGDAILDETCENTHVVNEMDVPVLAMGLKDVIIAASPDGILVADKGRSSYMKPYVDKIVGPVMYAEKSWGSYKVLDAEKGSITVKVTLLPDHYMNYHSHERRSEIWTVIEGTGAVVLDDKEFLVSAGDIVKLPVGCKHSIKAITLLKLTEVQIGEDISAEDKIKYQWEWKNENT